VNQLLPCPYVITRCGPSSHVPTTMHLIISLVHCYCTGIVPTMQVAVVHVLVRMNLIEYTSILNVGVHLDHSQPGKGSF